MENTGVLKAGKILQRVVLNISQIMINRYAEVSGDFNPVHVDVEGAANSEFGGTIAHGCIPLEPLFQGLSEALRRPDLPLETQISVRYRKPSRPGDRIHLEARVLETGSDGNVKIAFSCVNQNEQAVLEGECLVPTENVRCEQKEPT
jgi:3-hydroxybutyryl-CoA dehydratase|tara:strand:- start:568 stop:1008 length:441 start_codon:yes stop_codon:yes gene_type:complete